MIQYSKPYFTYCIKCNQWIKHEPGWALDAVVEIRNGTWSRYDDSDLNWEGASEEACFLLGYIYDTECDSIERQLRCKAHSKITGGGTTIKDGKEVRYIYELAHRYLHDSATPEWDDLPNNVYLIVAIIQCELSWIPIRGYPYPFGGRDKPAVEVSGNRGQGTKESKEE